ncbi:MAG: hypothetical protein IK083_09825 [Abditibacteriota bacterium]|nr:hypothetical protein [Abditibacteriota bacterium]
MNKLFLWIGAVALLVVIVCCVILTRPVERRTAGPVPVRAAAPGAEPAGEPGSRQEEAASARDYPSSGPNEDPLRLKYAKDAFSAPLPPRYRKDLAEEEYVQRLAEGKAGSVDLLTLETVENPLFQMPVKQLIFRSGSKTLCRYNISCMFNADKMGAPPVLDLIYKKGSLRFLTENDGRVTYVEKDPEDGLWEVFSGSTEVMLIRGNGSSAVREARFLTPEVIRIATDRGTVYHVRIGHKSWELTRDTKWYGTWELTDSDREKMDSHPRPAPVLAWKNGVGDVEEYFGSLKPSESVSPEEPVYPEDVFAGWTRMDRETRESMLRYSVEYNEELRGVMDKELLH